MIQKQSPRDHGYDMNNEIMDMIQRQSRRDHGYDMNHEIMDESNMEADHINGDTSDNRLKNLRPVTKAVNNENREWVDYRQMLANHTDRSKVG